MSRLLEAGVPAERLREFGLGYALIANTLKKHSNVRTKVGISKLSENITTKELQYAKRQIRWFKRDKRIKWFHPRDVEKITEIISRFLNDDVSTNA